MIIISLINSFYNLILLLKEYSCDGYNPFSKTKVKEEIKLILFISL
jgi:hypothetical protein